MNQQWTGFLRKHEACKEGYAEAHKQPPSDWWKTTQRGDWMIWVMRKSGLPVEKMVWVKIAVFSGKQSLKYVRKGEHRPQLAVEAAEAWVNCPTPATQEEARVTAQNARHAAADAYAAAAAYAAADAYAAAAAYAAADAAAADAYAAAAAYAADADAYAADAYAAAAYAAYAAADAAADAYAAAAAYAADAYAAAAYARKNSRSNLADYIRSIIPDFDWSFLEIK